MTSDNKVTYGNICLNTGVAEVGFVQFMQIVTKTLSGLAVLMQLLLMAIIIHQSSYCTTFVKFISSPVHFSLHYPYRSITHFN